MLQCMELMIHECKHDKESQRGFFTTINSIDLEGGLSEGGEIGRIDQILDWGVETSAQNLFHGMISVRNIA